MLSTLHRDPVAPLLARLFAEAEATDERVLAPLRALPPDERARLLAPAGEDWRGLYTRLGAAFLPVSRELGALLYLLARARGARRVVEFGTSFGLSTLHLAAALRDGGSPDARVIGSEFEPTKVRRAREHLAAAGLADLVEIREGDARTSLADVPGPVDLVLLDGAKPLYVPILRLLEPRLAAGAVIVADNVASAPELVAHAVPANGYLPVPLRCAGEECLLALRLG
jgi:predicted O-methyltransferase YrrM